VVRVIRTIEAIAVKATAANETTPSTAKVLVADVRHATGANTTGVTSAEASNAGTAKATHVTSTKATHVTSTKAAHVASAKTTATTVSTTTAAAAGFRTGGKQAAGKHRSCQNHHYSSSHDILHWDGRTFRHRASSNVGVTQQSKRRRRDSQKMGMRINCLY
jgi:hypothetical protein